MPLVYFDVILQSHHCLHVTIIRVLNTKVQNIYLRPLEFPFLIVWSITLSPSNPFLLFFVSTHGLIWSYQTVVRFSRCPVCFPHTDKGLIKKDSDLILAIKTKQQTVLRDVQWQASSFKQVSYIVKYTPNNFLSLETAFFINIDSLKHIIYMFKHE